MEKKLYKFLLLNLGCFIAALPAAFFFSKVNLPPGGIYSVALITYNFLNLGGNANNIISIISIIYNMPLLVGGYYVFGFDYVLRVLYATFAYPIYVMIIDTIFNPIITSFTPSIFTAIVAGGIVMGLGIALTIHSGANTGGTDIVAQIINKYFPKITIGMALSAINLFIMLGSFLVLGASNTVYGVMVVLLISYFVDLGLKLFKGRI